MTMEEILRRTQEGHATARRASEQHQLAMQAFNVAIGRHDWVLAQTEHQAAIDHLDAYLNALMSIHRLAEEIETGSKR